MPPTPGWLVLLLACAPLARAQIGATRLDEAQRLSDAALATVSSLPVGNRARDTLRLLHGKLASLQEVENTREAHEMRLLLLL